MSQPKIGMHYEDCARRIKRIARGKGNPIAKCRLIESIKNQSRLNDGEGAVTELEKECQSNKSSMSGTGNKQCGIGPGKRWTEEEYIANGWVRDGIGWKKIIN